MGVLELLMTRCATSRKFNPSRALLVAAKRGVEHVKMLINSRIDANWMPPEPFMDARPRAEDEAVSRQTALHVAVETGDIDVVKFLLDRSAKANIGIV